MLPLCGNASLVGSEFLVRDGLGSWLSLNNVFHVCDVLLTASKGCASEFVSTDFE